jgi:alkylation response protein AidB-like acyl-CoA dehydrogenase
MTQAEPSSEELEDFRREVRAWIENNAPKQPPFKLPDSFMEVGTDEQFNHLRDWQAKVYAAGYLGMTWPEAYGGGGRPPGYQRVVNLEMARAKVPFMVNVIAKCRSNVTFRRSSAARKFGAKGSPSPRTGRTWPMHR